MFFAQVVELADTWDLKSQASFGSVEIRPYPGCQKGIHERQVKIVEVGKLL